MDRTTCIQRRRSGLICGLLALSKKRRRLGYAHGAPRRLRVLLLSALLLLRKSIRCTCSNCQNNPCRNGQRRWWQRPIFADHDRCGAWATLLPALRDTDEDMFYNFMRMTPATFDRLLNMVAPFMRKVSWRKAISPGERLATTLRYLASGDSQTSLSYLFRVSNQAISKIVLETTGVLWHVLKKNVFPPINRDLWLRVAADFQVMWNIPHCIGAIDGKQVPIKAFPHSGSRWFGYKKRHCMTLMAVCDAKHRFLIVESGASGKRSDGNIFMKSSFSHQLAAGKLNLPPPCPVPSVDADMPFFFVGDCAYGQTKNFATPFKGSQLRDEELVYNYRLSRARRVIENAFGIMCSRYRILFGPIEGSPTLVRHIILACMALHNFHLQDEESVPPKRRRYKGHGYADYIRGDGKYIYGRWRHENPERAARLLGRLRSQVANTEEKAAVGISGKRLAEMLLKYFVFNPVPWQWLKANLLL